VSRGTWTLVAERGSLLGMRFTVWAYRCLGRRASGWLALAIVSYFFVTDRRGRRASRRYLERLYATPGGAVALGHPPGLRDCFRHYREFARSILDRLAFALGEGDRFSVEVHGQDALATLRQGGQGAVLIGAHLGNFDALRALARRDGAVVNIVMFTRHAERINGLLRRLDPAAEVRVIHLDPAVPDTALRLRACVERGEFVALLGDRAGATGRARTARAPFLGRDAAFPIGPFVLAAALGCPVILIVGLRRGEAAYEVFAETLADRVPLAPRLRAESLPGLVRRYAGRLEAYCLRAPYQWFNFYDFWGEERAAGGARR
jgi:predicted LPLAT superfamily acyltransferase